MRLENYLTEVIGKAQNFRPSSEIIKILERDCSKFIKESKHILFRGFKTSKYKAHEHDIITVKPRTNRMPKDTDESWHNATDEYFNDKFGWKPRSEGVFATNSYPFASGYGLPWLFFPIDSYQYVWSPKVFDFFVVTDGYPEVDINSKEDFYPLMDRLGYKNNDLNSLNRQEIMFKCKSYYAVNIVYLIEILDRFGHMKSDGGGVMWSNRYRDMMEIGDAI